MNGFIRKVIAAAIVITTAGFAAASQAKANGLQFSYNSQVKIITPDFAGGHVGLSHLSDRKAKIIKGPQRHFRYRHAQRPVRSGKKPFFVREKHSRRPVHRWGRVTHRWR